MAIQFVVSNMRGWTQFEVSSGILELFESMAGTNVGHC